MSKKTAHPELEAHLAELQGECSPTQALYGLIFENAPGGMLIATVDGYILACNQEAADLCGYSASTLTGENTLRFYRNPKDKKKLGDHLKAGKNITNYELALNCKDNVEKWVSLSGKPIVFAGKKAALITLTDITAYRKALQQLELDEIRFERLYALSEMINKPESEILNFALEAITSVSSSKIGYIYFLNKDETELTLYAWSKDVMDQCMLESIPEVYKVEDTGLWGDAVRQRKPIITNNYQKLEDKRGYPKGHIPITNHLNIPVFDENQIILLAGVGNKDGDYTEKDVRQLELVMNGTWRIIQRKRAAAALKAAHEELEGKVKRRTKELEKLNKDLAILNLQLVKKDKEWKQINETLVRYERIISSTPDLIFLVDRNYIYRMVNDAYLKHFGKKRNEIINKQVTSLTGKKLFESTIKERLDRAFSGEIVNVENWMELPKLGRCFLATTFYPVSIYSKDIDYVSVEARDMTDLKLKEEALTETAARLDLATNAGNIGIWEWDLIADDTNWDNEMYKLYNVQPGEFESIYEAWRTRLHEEDLAETERELADCIEKKKRFESEFRIVWADGSIHYIKAAADVRLGEDGTPRTMTGVNWDVTEQRNMEKELRKLASTDPLTGANNRRQFMARMEEEFTRCKRYKTNMVLLSLDIDHFKNVNDSYGHPAGDDVLRDLVQKCISTLRTTDLFGRVGGEEFLAALLQTNIMAGQRTAERIRKIIESTTVEAGGQHIPYTISIGLTQLQPDDTSIESLLSRADKALYKAKNSGRNRVEVL